MGLNSGEVVVGTIGEDLRLDYTAIGHTVGLAQRLVATGAGHFIAAAPGFPSRLEQFLSRRAARPHGRNA
jgi:class 3 adenylate cyclase